MIRAAVVRALVLTAAFAAALTPVRCLGEDGNQLPTKATKELPPELLSMFRQQKMPKHSLILVRIFKEEAELEVWKQDTTGRFRILKIFPICRWSGDLGPKLHEGDRQAPEGFYTITPELMNPNSDFYLAINTGFPNSFDKANKRDGSSLMIHGDCSSSGCYAMTDEQMGEIYSLARDLLAGGRAAFQVQAYPFRLTPANLARHRTNPNLAFWKMLKIGNDHFEATHLEPKVDVCNRRYVFNVQPPPNSPDARCHLLGICVFQAPTAELGSLIAGASYPGKYALADHGAFELGKDAHHLEHRPAGGCGGIKALLMQEQIDAFGMGPRRRNMRDRRRPTGR